jgi:pyruvate/2-oxoglutarate/acetoin dehydrogenase E1 component
MAIMSVNQAVHEALAEEMRRDDRVIAMGEDVQLSSLGGSGRILQDFGPDRIRNTPISELSVVGMALGAAAAGLRPVVYMMIGNFLYTAMDQFGNQASKLRYMSGGQLRFPVVYFARMGGGSSLAAQHSESPHSIFVNLGIKVVVPSTPADAKGLMKVAIRDDDPVIFLQHDKIGSEVGDVPEGDFLVPLGQADTKLEGRDVTVVAIGGMVQPTLAVARQLVSEGIKAEVIDPRTLMPLDRQTVLASVAKTGRLVVVDDSRMSCSMASEVAASVVEDGFHLLRAPVRRVTTPDVPIPFSPPLERAVIPDESRIAAAIHQTVADHV